MLTLLASSLLAQVAAPASAMEPPKGPPRSDAPPAAVKRPLAGEHATWEQPALYPRSIGPVNVLEVRPDISMLTIDGVNLAVATGPQGTLVIGTVPARGCEAMLAAVEQITSSPIRYVINTSGDDERVGCNAMLAQAGEAFTPGRSGNAAPVIATQSTLLQVLSQRAKYPESAQPSEVFTRNIKSFYLNGQGVQVIAMPAAHTGGDAMVVLRRSDVVVAGDIFDPTRFPVIDLERGGSIQGEIAALNRLLDDLVIPGTPKIFQAGGTLVIPGRGQLCQLIDVLNYRDMVTIIRDRVQALLEQGKSLAEVQASAPARGFTTRYGSDKGAWTTSNFIEAVYKSLEAQRPARHGAED